MIVNETYAHGLSCLSMCKVNHDSPTLKTVVRHQTNKCNYSQNSCWKFRYDAGESFDSCSTTCFFTKHNSWDESITFYNVSTYEFVSSSTTLATCIHSKESKFKNRLGYRLLWSRFFVVFLSPSRRLQEWCLKSIPLCATHFFHFIIH
jgi:hypothetical protein